MRWESQTPILQCTQLKRFYLTERTTLYLKNERHLAVYLTPSRLYVFREIAAMSASVNYSNASRSFNSNSVVRVVIVFRLILEVKHLPLAHLKTSSCNVFAVFQAKFVPKTLLWQSKNCSKRSQSATDGWNSRICWRISFIYLNVSWNSRKKFYLSSSVSTFCYSFVCLLCQVVKRSSKQCISPCFLFLLSLQQLSINFSFLIHHSV